VSSREPAPPSSTGLLAYPAVLIGLGLVMVFAVAGSQDLGQPLAGILTGAGVLAILAGAGLVLGWILEQRRTQR
jgi:hypothetical protein